MEHDMEGIYGTGTGPDGNHHPGSRRPCLEGHREQRNKGRSHRQARRDDGGAGHLKTYPMKSYLDIVRHILDHGERKENRTGVDALTVAGVMFEHDMAQGFPLLTTKKMPFKTIRVELEFFIKGLTDKKWLQDRRCTIWNERANPKKAPYGHDEASKKRMAEERDLGPVYGFQWRHFDAPYENWDTDYAEKGIDQLKTVVDRLKSNPNHPPILLMP